MTQSARLVIKNVLVAGTLMGMVVAACTLVLGQCRSC